MSLNNRDNDFFTVVVGTYCKGLINETEDEFYRLYFKSCDMLLTQRWHNFRIVTRLAEKEIFSILPTVDFFGKGRSRHK